MSISLGEFHTRVGEECHELLMAACTSLKFLTAQNLAVYLPVICRIHMSSHKISQRQLWPLPSHSEHDNICQAPTLYLRRLLKILSHLLIHRCSVSPEHFVRGIPSIYGIRTEIKRNTALHLKFFYTSYLGTVITNETVFISKLKADGIRESTCCSSKCGKVKVKLSPCYN